MPLGMAFPCESGFIPGTRAGDGDPIDVLVLADAPLFPGCFLEGRLLGAFEIEQADVPHSKKRVRNDRLVGVPAVSTAAKSWRNLDDMGRSASMHC